MENVLGALRLFVAGRGSESEVFRCAASLPYAQDRDRCSRREQANFTSEIVIAGDFVDEDDDSRVDNVEVEVVTELVDECHRDIEQEKRNAFEAKDFKEVAELYTWGQATNYQLGFGVLSEVQPNPRCVPLSFAPAARGRHDAQIRMVACGRFHSVAVSACGSVFSWGVNGKTFRLGIDPTSGSVPPPCVVQPTALQEFGAGRHCAVKAAAGQNHTLVLTTQGKIFAWGSNVYGQLGAQGVQSGSDAHARRPREIKGSLKNDEVADIAAGAEHSLCTVVSGNVFTWGSNACGSLGLGPPPSGPAEVASPQQLPHLRGAYAVAASHSGHVSIVLASHGDAVMFGALSPQALSHSDGRGASSAAKADAAHTRFFTTSRVRREELKDSGDNDDWQMQRGGTGAAGPRLLSVVLGAEEAFSIDADGTLWTWPLSGPRPCTAKAARMSATPLPGTPAGGRRSSAVAALTSTVGADSIPSRWSTVAAAAGCSDVLWATDRTETPCLWRLRRAASAWHVERFEALAQVSAVACGPEHQTAIITYKRPLLQSEQSITAKTAEKDSDEEDEPASNPTFQVPSLQKLCEDQLLRSLSPRNFNLVCEVGWEFRRPEVLDHAFSFLRANASLMFSRQHLPSLAQLLLEVLCAFEMAANGALTAPSAALNFDPWDFPPEEMRPCPDHDGEAPSMALPADVATTTATVSSGTVRRRRRGGSGAGPSPKAKASSPPCSSVPVAPQSKETSPMMLPAAAMSPQTGPAKSPKSMPVAASASNSADPQKWMEVQNRRKPNGAATPSAIITGVGGNGKASPPSGPHMVGVQSPSSSPAGWGPTSASSPTSSFKQATEVTLGDFVLPKAAVPRKSSASDSVDNPGEQVSEGLPRGWAQTEPAEAPVSLKDILAEASMPSKRRSSTKEEDPTNEPTHCSWGYDAMPSQRPKGPSVYEVQQLERSEKSRLQEEAEIREIEAMFQALEVAEQEEERELLGIPTSSGKSPTGNSGSNAPSTTSGKAGKGSNRTSRVRSGAVGADDKKVGADEKQKKSDTKKKPAGKAGDTTDNFASQRQRGWHRGNWNGNSWSGWQWSTDSWWQGDAQNASKDVENWSTGGAGHAGRGGRGNRGKRGGDRETAAEGGQRWHSKEDGAETIGDEDVKQHPEAEPGPQLDQS